MSDLISRAATIEMLDRLNCCGWVESAWEDVLHAIERVPAAQPKIIHCGDCRYWKNNHLCECLSRYGTFETEIYFYCGFAERREE